MKTFSKIKIAGAVILLTCAIAFFATFRADVSLEDAKAQLAYPDSQYVEIEGMQVHFRDVGEGEETILLIHGTLGSVHVWQQWIEMLSGDYRVVALDMPGSGLTGPFTTGSYEIEHYVDVLKEFFDRVGIDKAHVVGNSFGAYAAWRFAAVHKNRVDRLVLIGSPGMPGHKSPLITKKIANLPILNWSMRYNSPRTVYRKGLLKAYGKEELISEDMVDRYYLIARTAGNRWALRNMFRETYATLRPDLAKEIEAPTLLLWGENDALVSASLASEFEARIPDVRTQIYDDAGHMIIHERMGAVVGDMLSFFAEPRSAVVIAP